MNRNTYELHQNDVKQLTVLLSSDEERFGGKGRYDSNLYIIKNGTIKIEIGAFTGIYFVEN